LERETEAKKDRETDREKDGESEGKRERDGDVRIEKVGWKVREVE
jgi:hypothetical protein